MEFWGHEGVAHFGISVGKGGLKHGSRPWLGMNIFWNCPIWTNDPISGNAFNAKQKKWGDGLIYTRLKINKLFTFFMISVIFLKMGKHSNFQIISLQVVDVWRILQFNRKNEKYFKEFIWFWGTLSQNYRRLCGSLIMFKKHNLIPVQL